MLPLKFPDYSPKVREGERKEIFCIVRKKYVAMTPEEWVRQHLLNFLIAYLDYPRGMVKIERTLKYASLCKRSDVVVLDRTGRTFFIAECKSYDIPPDQKAVVQLAAYNKILDAKYLAITNGLVHYVWQKNENGWRQNRTFPNYPAY